jgi:hypothetical protein
VRTAHQHPEVGSYRPFPATTGLYRGDVDNDHESAEDATTVGDGLGVNLSHLPPKRAAAEVLLASGRTGVDVAGALDVGERTVRRWRSDPDVRDAIADVSAALSERLAAEAFALDRAAVDVVAEAVESGDRSMALAWLRMRDIGSVRRPNPVETLNAYDPITPERLAEMLTNRMRQLDEERDEWEREEDSQIPRARHA